MTDVKRPASTPLDPLRVAEQKSAYPVLPQGRRTYQSVNQCDTLAGSRIACEARSTGLRGYAP